MEELTYYYVPQLMDKENWCGDKSPAIAALIATQLYKDGKIVIGHNNWTSYITTTLECDHRFCSKKAIMCHDCMPGFIHSGDDFVISSNGILITETALLNSRV
jgi:hypothetical protein